MKKIKYLIVALVFVAVAYPLSSTYLENRAKEKSANNLENGVILYDLEGYQFDVPLKYYYLIYQKTNRWPTPKKERQAVGPSIYVVLPDMLPFSEQTTEKFEARGWKDKMRITLRSREYLDDLGWFKKRKDKFTIIGLSGEAPGLIHLIDHHGAVVENDKNYDHLFLKSVDNFEEYFYMRCHRNLQEGGMPFPSCKLHAKYKKLKLEITFSREHIADWEKIMTDSVKLLDDFRVNAN